MKSKTLCQTCLEQLALKVIKVPSPLKYAQRIRQEEDARSKNASIPGKCPQKISSHVQLSEQTSLWESKPQNLPIRSWPHAFGAALDNSMNDMASVRKTHHPRRYKQDAELVAAAAARP